MFDVLMLIKELIQQPMQQNILKKPLPKKSLCRFYLRGLCIYQSHECQQAHGVWDLNYDYYTQGEHIQYDFNPANEDLLKPKEKGKRIYKDLYQFQIEKIYTLEELNDNRQARLNVRNQMHKQIYREFMELLEIKNPDMMFTEQFLLREFTRVGFNKILFGILKFNHILSNLCDFNGSSYVKVTKILPPNPTKQNIIVRKASWQQICQYYKIQIQIFAKKSQNPVQQNVLKKHLFTSDLPLNISPLNVILKDLKMSLSDFIAKQLGQASELIKAEASLQQILKQANIFIKSKMSQSLISWNDVYNHLTKTLKCNNGNILNQVKPSIVMQQNAFLFFPMVQFIFNPHSGSECFQKMRKIPCKCSFQQPYSLQQLMIQSLEIKQQLKEGQCFDIDNFETLMLCAPHILNSKVLGVDLQGRLRRLNRGGFVEMIQLNNGRNTFLFDIWHMNQKADFQTFWLTRKILRNVMVDEKIVKIFHDCRHDSVGLHQIIQTCVKNVFDTSACETLIGQLQKYNHVWNSQTKDLLKQCREVINQCTNVRSAGLNEIFSKYKAKNGINKNKQKFHKMWSTGQTGFFCKRPLHPEYRDYCIRDVLDLPQMLEKMLKQIPQSAKQMAFWISEQYAKKGYYDQQQLDE